MQDDRSRSELEAELKRHRGLVQATALHYAKRCHEPLDDLTQEGWIGFLRAYQGSERLRERPLGAYAKPFIRGAILRYLRDKGQLVRLPRSAQERLQELRRLKRQAGTQKGLSPDALRRVTGWSAASLMALEQAELLMRCDHSRTRTAGNRAGLRASGRSRMGPWPPTGWHRSPNGNAKSSSWWCWRD